MHRETGRLIERATTWFLVHGSQPLDITRNITDYGAGVHRAIQSLDSVLAESDREYLDRKTASFVERGAPESLARRVASLRLLVSACDIVRISREVDTSVERAGAIYFAIGDQLDIDWLRREATNCGKSLGQPGHHRHRR
jgi:glutamate dehydrogenase